MNHALKLIALAVIATAAAPVVAQRGSPQTTLAGRSPDEMIADFMHDHGISGMTLSIVQAPYIPRVVGYGVADKDHGLLASPNTLWPLGEITQGYTAVAVMQLVEDGQLALDDRIGDRVENLPSEWRSITLRQLLGHTSGLPDYSKQPGFDPTREHTTAEIISSIRDNSLAFKPGTDVERSATNFFLLGLAIEKASGMSYEDFVTRGQIEPLGLKRTLFPSQLDRVKQDSVEQHDNRHTLFLQSAPYIDPTEIAVGSADASDTKVQPPRNRNTALSANASLLASATDVSIWDVALAGDILVKKAEDRAFIYNGFTLDTGSPCPANCGWRFPAYKGFMDITGNPPGYSAYLSRFTAKSELVCVTLCCNKEGIDLTELGRRIAGCFDPKIGPPVSPDAMQCMESCYPVGATIDRIAADLKSRGVPVAARIDHAAHAKAAGLDLRPTQVLIFGDPRVGTKLMLQNQAWSIDLPLRVTAWEDEKGSTWVGWHPPTTLSKALGISGDPDTLAKMEQAIAGAVAHATSPY